MTSSSPTIKEYVENYVAMVTATKYSKVYYYLVNINYFYTQFLPLNMIFVPSVAKFTLNIHVSDSFLPLLVSPMLSHSTFCPG